jgi:hypothetical protein
MNLNKFIWTCIVKRTQKLPIVEYITPPFMAVSAIFGGVSGLGYAFKYDNGILWRPSLGIVTGGSIGFVIGLYPYHAVSLLLLSDIVYTISDEKNKQNGG